MKDIKRSCADCAAISCHKGDGKYPAFCVSENMDKELKEKAISQYTGEELKMMQVAALVECDGYGHLTRVLETIDFAKRMGYKKIGIATCVGLIKETNTLAKILRSHGLEVFGIGCKAGEVLKRELDIEPRCDKTGVNICNPILQAETLNKENTDFNIIMGLCVGHDMLFTKHSKAPVTTLVAKDRVMGHNPVAALYTSNWYYTKLYGEDEQ